MYVWYCMYGVYHMIILYVVVMCVVCGMWYVVCGMWYMCVSYLPYHMRYMYGYD